MSHCVYFPMFAFRSPFSLSFLVRFFSFPSASVSRLFISTYYFPFRPSSSSHFFSFSFPPFLLDLVVRHAAVILYVTLSCFRDGNWVFRAGFWPDSALRPASARPEGRLRCFPGSSLAKSGPEVRFLARKHYCGT